MHAVIFSLAAFVATTFGGIIAFRYSNKLHPIIAFSAGALLGVCFFDVIPEIFAIAGEGELAITPALIAIIAGFLLIHTLEKLALIHTAAHESEYAEHKHPLVGLVGAGGLILHSFLDGVGIGLAFHVNVHVGFVVAIAIIAHDFCDGLNTVTLMLMNKNTRAKALAFLGADALAPIAGALSTYLFTIPNQFLLLYLGFFAGFLLYISAGDLLPEAHSQHSSYKTILMTVLGVVFMFVVTRFLE
jgi:ZIP family zinc transporter